MTETLGQKQRRFTLMLAQWVIAISRLGYAVTWGEAFRSDEQAEINAMGEEGRARLAAYLMPHYPELARRIANNVGSGIRNSLHECRLAVDVNLFYGGSWISDGDSPHWERVGNLWESMGGAWGGRFQTGDANHLSLEYEGRR